MMNVFVNCLLLINTYRQLHQVPNVSISPSVMASAQSWANILYDKNIFDHSKSIYGENIAKVSTISDVDTMCCQSVNMWYSEYDKYNYSKAAFHYTSGHFTQLVWKSTQYIGIGIAGRYVVMQYDPPGNYAGQFSNNVFPPKSTILNSPPIYPPKRILHSPSPPHVDTNQYSFVIKTISRSNCNVLNLTKYVEQTKCYLQYLGGSGYYYKINFNSPLSFKEIRDQIMPLIVKSPIEFNTITLQDGVNTYRIKK